MNPATGMNSSSALGMPQVSPVPSQARPGGTAVPVAITVRW